MAELIIRQIVGLEDKEDNNKDLWGAEAFIKLEKVELTNLLSKLNKGSLNISFNEEKDDVVLKKL